MFYNIQCIYMSVLCHNAYYNMHVICLEVNSYSSFHKLLLSINDGYGA